ncbi:hypothetical protein [Pseudomonas yamanorum]|uniref:Uncharacterized protein n=1 Tax=Pseudomonas yamanorum TaxID=515393 RepID=A0AAJ3H5Y1_9PSED|nr:hypothetical protein [Pseudomonas yamanorum]NWD44163.1 hypothetical protein [Pseudomonas yamanorum]
MLEKIKDRITYAFTPAEKKLRLAFENKLDAARVARSENGDYIDPAIETEWQKELAILQEDIDRSFIR